MTQPAIRILVDGKHALTTAQFAAEVGVEPVTVRTELRRIGVEPVAYLDARTPLYGAAATRKAWRARPGKGGGKSRRAQ